MQRRLDELEILIPAERAATNCDNAAVTCNLTITITVKQRRQQFAHREITRATENNQVEDVDGEKFSHRESPDISESLLHFYDK